MVENYYRLMGWDPKTGKPLPETLKQLGLEEISKVSDPQRGVRRQDLKRQTGEYKMKRDESRRHCRAAS